MEDIGAIVESLDNVRAVLKRLVTQIESRFDDPWAMETQPADFLDHMAKGVVAFEIPITRLEGKWKMGQNRTDEDRLAAAGRLAADDDPQAWAVAELMRAGQPIPE